MGKAATFTKTGTKAKAQSTLPPAIFDLKVSDHELLRRAYLAYLANRRRTTARTKTRGQVSGGGRKPHVQKGTGRARAGSIRQPNWVGGGVVFGPRGEENYHIKLSRRSKRTAIRQALSLKQAAAAVVVIEDLEVKDGKTKSAAALLKKLGADRRTLLVTAESDPKLRRSVANLPLIEAVSARYLSVYKLLNADRIVITKPAMKVLEEWLVPAAPKEQRDE